MTCCIVASRIFCRWRGVFGIAFRESTVQEKVFAHARMESTQEDDFSVISTQVAIVKKLKLIPTASELPNAPQKPASADETALCQGKMNEAFRSATVFRPGICARLARLAYRVDASQGPNLPRINDVVWTVKEWWKATILKYAAASRPKDRERGPAGEEMRARGGTVRRGTTLLVGWSGNAYRDQLAEGEGRHVSRN